MSMLHADKRPCSTCPYRKDTPPGIWDSSEYERLPDWDEDSPEIQMGLFLCHHSNFQTTETLCRGWLTVASESIAVRIAMMDGKVDPDEVYADVDVPLYATGQEACEAGLSGVDSPDEDARQAIDRLIRKKTKTLFQPRRTG